MTERGGTRVLVLTGLFPSTPDDGNGNHIFHQCLALQRVGVEVTVLHCNAWRGFSGAADHGSFRKAGLHVRRSSYFSLPRHHLRSLALPVQFRCLWPSIRQIAAREQIKIIHAHGESLAYVAVECAKRLGVRSFVTLHGINPHGRILRNVRTRGQMQAALVAADLVTLVGSGEPIRRYFRHLDWCGSNATLLTNGIVLSEVLPSSRVPRSRRIRVVSVANLRDRKGQDMLLRAVAVIEHQRVHDFEVVLVGDGPERNNFERLAKEAGIEEHVHFTGSLRHPDALAEVAAGDLFCMVSSWDACPLAPLEAMSLGKPTIACVTEGNRDYMEQGVTGYLVSRNAPDELARLLLDLRQNWEDCLAVGARARTTVRAHYSWENYAFNLKRWYVDRTDARRLPTETIEEWKLFDYEWDHLLEL